jgi:uncharacterized protein
MLCDADRAIACELRNRVSALVRVLDLVVFGSRARGDAEGDSDLDVFILVERVTPALRRQITDIGWEVGFGPGRVVSTIVAAPGDLEGAFGASPILLAIETEGVRP